MRHTIRTTALVAALAILPTLAAAQQRPDPEAIARGGRLYGQTCARCHNPRPPTERSDREWATIMLHMRARANLVKEDAEAILAFIQATNGGGGVVAAGAASGEAGAGVAADGQLFDDGFPILAVPMSGGSDAGTARRVADYLATLRVEDPGR